MKSEQRAPNMTDSRASIVRLLAVSGCLALGIAGPANRVFASPQAPSPPKNLRIVADTAPVSSSLTGYYGSGLNSDGLANTTVGEAGQSVSYRFRAQHTGVLQQVRVYLMFGQSGYWAGTGGSLRLDVYADNGSGSPGGPVLGSALLPSATANGFFPLIRLSPAPSLLEGTVYHIVWTNPDPDAAHNFVSVNALWQNPVSTPRQPTMDNTDFSVLLRVGSGSWNVRNNFTPILQLDYTDGFNHGVGYMEVWVSSPHQIGGAQSVRETFTVSGTVRRVSGVGLRLKRVSGTGPLTIRLETAAGQLLEERQVDSSSVPTGYGWVTAALTTTPTLQAGQGYNLVLLAPSGTVYSTFPMRDGSMGYGFSTSTVFGDGYAQFNSGSGWVGWDMWGATNRKEGDLQFYFNVAP